MENKLPEILWKNFVDGSSLRRIGEGIMPAQYQWQPVLVLRRRATGWKHVPLFLTVASVKNIIHKNLRSFTGKKS